jgi:hypothetical protein
MLLLRRTPGRARRRSLLALLGRGGVTGPQLTGMSGLAPIPRLALTREEAAAAIGMSLDSFERHVQPTIKLVRLGRMRLVPVGELERWLGENAERTVETTHNGRSAA